MTLDKTAKEQSFKFVYSNPLLRYVQNWGHIVTAQFLPPGGLILDLGAGTGEHQNFARKGDRYIALDADLDVLRIGREQGRTPPNLQAFAQRLPFANASFDGVVAVYILEHLSDLETCIAELARLLKPGGVLSVALPTEGMMFRLGRRLVTAPFAVRKLGFASVQAYEDYVATLHINQLEDIFACLERRFELVEMRWFPFLISSKALNTVVALKALRR